ncbi:MAG: hypothetical protein WC521_03390 [Bdellovibrionales bacterium]|jgi:hypothetical protein
MFENIKRTSYLSSFWKKHQSFLNGETLEAEAREVPPLAELSAFDLSHFANTLGVYQNKYYHGEPSSFAIKYWKRKEEEWTDAVCHKIFSFNKKDHMVSFFAFVRLSKKPSKKYWNAFFPAAAEKLPESRVAVMEGIHDVFDKDDFLGLLRVLSHFDQKPPSDSSPQSFETRLFRALIANLNDFDGREMYFMLSHLNKLEVVLPSAFKTAFVSHFTGKLVDLPPEDLFDVPYQLDHLKINLFDEEIFAKRYLSLTYEYLDSSYRRHLNPESRSLYRRRLVSMAKGLARGKIIPDEHYKKRLNDALFDALPDCNDMELSRIGYSYAFQGRVPNDAFLKELAGVASKKIDVFGALSSSNLLWAIAVFSVKRVLPPEILGLAEKLADRAASIQLNETDSHFCHLACLRLFPEKKDSFQPFPPKGDPCEGEIALLNFFISNGYTPAATRMVIPSLGTEIPYVFSSGERTVYMTYDTRSVFAKDFEDNSLHPRGSVNLMTALLWKERPKEPGKKFVLIRLQHTEAEALVKSQDTKMLHMMMDRIFALRTGVYKIRFHKDSVSSPSLRWPDAPSGMAQPETPSEKPGALSKDHPGLGC